MKDTGKPDRLGCSGCGTCGAACSKNIAHGGSHDCGHG
jgi:ferredoxin